MNENNTTLHTTASVATDNSISYMNNLHKLNQIENEILHAIAVGNDTSALDIWYSNSAFIFSILPKNLQNPIRTVKNYLISINTLFRKILELNKFHLFYLEPIFAHFIMEIERCDTLEQLEMLPKQLIISYCEISRNHGKTLRSPFVETALTYIKENLNNDLTLHSISKFLNITPSYFSALFTKEMGMSLTDYVTNSRISLAKSLLASTDMPIKNVCTACGFHNFSYFCHVFKKHVGDSPKIFRQCNFNFYTKDNMSDNDI